jgi:hypothetical protein
VLRRGGLTLPLGGRALDILVYLAERPGEVIQKNELIDHVWSSVTVEEGSLRVQVAAIRKALGDGRFGNRYIANVKGRGYSFVASVIFAVDSTAATTVECAHRCLCLFTSRCIPSLGRDYFSVVHPSRLWRGALQSSQTNETSLRRRQLNSRTVSRLRR